MKPLPIKHLVFDLDSTLTDSLRTLAITRTAMLDELRALPGMDRLGINVDVTTQLRREFHDPDFFTNGHALCRWRENASEDCARALIELDHKYNDLLRLESTLIDGADELFSYCAASHISIVVWTNKKAPFARRHIHDLKLDRVICALYARKSDVSSRYDRDVVTKFRVVDAADRKPSPATLLRICAECDFDPRQTAFVGNNPRNDGGSTIGTDVQFIQTAFALPSPYVEDLLYALTADQRLSFRAVREEERASDPRGNVTPIAILRNNLRELVSLIDKVNHHRNALRRRDDETSTLSQ